MKNLSSGILPDEVLADIGAQMRDLKREIAALEATEPPKDFAVEQIKAWLEALKAVPDDKAVHLLIERMDLDRTKEKTEFNIKSTLNSVLSKSGKSTAHGYNAPCFENVVHYYVGSVLMRWDNADRKDRLPIARAIQNETKHFQVVSSNFQVQH